MAFDDDDDDYDGDLEPFNPAKSVISHDEDIRKLFHNVCTHKFVELFAQQYPELNIDTQEFYRNYFGCHFMITEGYVEKIITHYYSSNLPFEDDLEPVDINNFPSNKEIKRFIKANIFYNDFDSIDRYSNSQPVDMDKEIQLAYFLKYFKILKAQVLEYYPQVEHLSARGLRELERSLYTITYLLWIDLNEKSDRMLGLKKEFYDELDRKSAERNEKLKEKSAKTAETPDYFDEYNKMTFEQKCERDKYWEERERLENMEDAMSNRLFEEMSDTFLGLFSHLNLPRLDFIAKAKKESWITYRDIFYIVLEMLEHFKTSDEPYKKDRRAVEIDRRVKYYGKLLKKNNKEDLDVYLETLDEWERGDLEFNYRTQEMTKTMLKVIYETFPKIINLPAKAMQELNDEIHGLARFNLKELFGARDRLLKVNPEIFEEFDKKVEDMQRKKYEEGG